MYSVYRISEMQVILRSPHTDNIAEKYDRRINQNISHHREIEHNSNKLNVSIYF